MKTTLEVVCAAFGFQGGTIHQVKQRFAIASQKEMDHVCGKLVDTEVTDPETKLYFMYKRHEAIGLHCIARYVKDNKPSYVHHYQGD